MKDFFSFFFLRRKFLEAARGCCRSVAFCFPRCRYVGRHCLFQQPCGALQAALGSRGSINLCKLLQCEEILNKKIPKHSLLSSLQSAQKLVGIHKYLSSVGEGQIMPLLSFIKVIPHFGGISGFILKRCAVRAYFKYREFVFRSKKKSLPSSSLFKDCK